MFGELRRGLAEVTVNMGCEGGAIEPRTACSTEDPLRARTVTIAIPVYKRLGLLCNALKCVRDQDYPHIDLLVSDNGGNGETLRTLVESHYPGPYRLRANESPVSVVEHFNQLLGAARGEYFVLLCDDDEISPDFASELVARLEKHPEAAVAIARPETVDAAGAVRRYEGFWAPLLTGDQFLEAWALKRLRLMSTVTLMARTTVARARGGYLDLPRALYSDNVLLIRLALGGSIVLGQHCAFRWRIDDASTGFSASYHEVAGACRGFLRYLDTDPQVAAYARQHPVVWRKLHRLLRHQCGRWYFFRWKERYAGRLDTREWVRAAFAVPFSWSYYALVRQEIVCRAKARIRRWLGGRWRSLAAAP